MIKEKYRARKKKERREEEKNADETWLEILTGSESVARN